MAKLTFREKQLIENVFGMSGGYIVDFRNRDFEEFMNDVVQYSIYEKYPGLSKAKMFRQFVKDETDVYVGKAIVLLINYMNENSLITDETKGQSIKLYELGKRLLGKVESNANSNQRANNPTEEVTVDFERLNNLLLNLEKISNPQTRGYEFEKYLNDLFQSFGLRPQASYRTEYDQIDGSFILENNTILIEAKYRRKPILKDDLILFSNKIQSKSHFTRGLFITYSQIEDKAISYFTDSSSRFIVFTVEELFIMCQNKLSIKTVLNSKFRYLDERGIIYKHVLSI